MKREKRLNNIIEALSQHEDEASVAVLEKIGTNCPNDEVRISTAKALVNRNSYNSLSIVITNRGKGINDLSTSVAMSTINDILALKDTEVALKVLNETEESNPDETVRETARSVKALLAFSSAN